jgi:lysophospholipase L1-like esterase
VHSTSIPSPQDPAFALRKRKTLVGNLVLSMGSVLIMLALAEGISSLMIPAPITWRDPQEIYNHDPLLGHALAPGQNSFTHSFPVVTNSYGFRDREYPLIPQAGTVRILCLGDSLTFGDGVAVEDTYPKQLETMLNVMGKHQYEVINTGVPSYDTWQEVTFFKTKGVQFEPRIVVLGFYGNDIVPRPAVIKTSLSGEGTLRRKGFGGFLPDGMVHLLKGSRFLLLLKDRVGKLVDSTKPSSEHLHQQALLDGLPDEFVEQGWQEVEASLLQMVELQKTREFRFLIVTFPMAEQLLREHPQAQYQARLKSIADKLDIPFIDLKPVFKREFRDFGSLFIEWDGHPNPKAHRLAAEEIARVLGSMIKTE